jgi:hypothetical protein
MFFQSFAIFKFNNGLCGDKVFEILVLKGAESWLSMGNGHISIDGEEETHNLPF